MIQEHLPSHSITSANWQNMLGRAQNNGLSQVIFRPTSAYDRAKSNLVGQILLYISNGEANDSL